MEIQEDPKVVEKFDPTLANLTEMVSATKNIKATDLKDKAQLAVVKENRIALKRARVQIEKAGKIAREDAIKFQKDVISYEKKLIAVIEPEEDRLAAIEEEAVQLEIHEKRLANLPILTERIEAAGLSSFQTKTEQEVLALDENAFEAYFNELGAKKVASDKQEAESALLKKQEEDRIARESEQKKIDEDNARKQQEQDAKAKELAKKEADLLEQQRKLDSEKAIKEAEDKARAETEARMKREAEMKVESDKKAAEDKIIADKAAAEKIEADRLAAENELNKKKQYQDFLTSVGMTKDNVSDFHKEETDTEIIVYKKVGSYKK